MFPVEQIIIALASLSLGSSSNVSQAKGRDEHWIEFFLSKIIKHYMLQNDKTKDILNRRVVNGVLFILACCKNNNSFWINAHAFTEEML